MSTTPQTFPPSLNRTPMLEQTGTPTWPWLKWFQSLGSPILPLSAVPATHDAAGQFGQVALDASFVYFCIAPNLWKRVAIASW